MHTSNRLSSRSLRNLLLAAAMLLPGAIALGDTVYIQTSGKPLKRDNVTINSITKDDSGAEILNFTTEGGLKDHKELSKVVQITVDGEGAFNQAEVEFAAGDFKAAGEGYRRAMASTTRDWLKHRADVRVLMLSQKTGDFLGAVTGYVAMAKTDPAAAHAHKPDTKAAKKEDLGSAIAAVNQGLAGAKTETKREVLPFLADLYVKSGDTTNATAVLNQLKTLSPAASVGPTNTVVGSTPAGPSESELQAQKQAEADIALSKATASFAAHDYTKTIADITGAQASFVDPDRQARALYLIAEAKAATATTPEAWQEAALAYMRVVAHFKAQPNGPAADALYKTGVIEEKLAKPTEALLIYNQVINEYSGSKAAQDAKAAAARLKK